MAYSVTDISELIRHHLVFSAPDREAADQDLCELVDEISHMTDRPLFREASWVFCDRCGTSVDTDLIHPDGHHYNDHGDFYCADCWASECGAD
jgi:hypothetical protein